MSYETAPATIMLATFCACCSRPLVDAVSVEAGVGPECRKRHGYAEAQGEPDWVAVQAELGNLVSRSVFTTQSHDPTISVAVSEAAWRLGGLETRRIANQLVHRIAVEQQGQHVLALTNALKALGYTKLAERIAHRLAPVQIELTEDGYVVKTPYSEEGVIAMRSVPGRRWVGKGRAGRNVFPVSSKRPLFETLRRVYHGTNASGPKGLFTL